MADDAQSIRSLNWRELFPFINLFRAFRIAIHPSKLVLGFLLLVFVYIGGNVLDAIWPASFDAVTGEVDLYAVQQWNPEPGRSFVDIRDESREKNTAQYKERLMALIDQGALKLDRANPDAILDAARRGSYHANIQADIVRRRNIAMDDANVALTVELKRIADAKDVKDDKKAQERRVATDAHDTAFRQAQEQTLLAIEHLNSITPRPIFDTFFDYESRQLHHIVDSALNGHWFDGVVHTSGDLPPQASALLRGAFGDATTGVVRGIANIALIGPAWLVSYHWFYFILISVWFLVVWAIFGGAIARIAAVHAARDEKISVRQALRFSASKLLSFVFAPLIPLIVVVAVGLLIAAGGLLLYIPYLGPVIVGALFFLPLLAGLIITLTATGTLGGFNLMYPTIAVEGSDSFDAISRSFSYIYARPWKMLFYTATSLVYGALCFLFMRFFVYVMLTVTQFFVQLLLVGQPARYWPEIWPPVSIHNLAYHINFQALKWSESLAAFLIAFWVYIILTFLASFVVSLYFSSNTLIYYLMRREVDATELDDVYIEEREDDFGDAPPSDAPATPSTPAVNPITPPAATEPPPSAPSTP